jgi:Mechanosensitive ion channel, conserved TM helix
MWQQIQGIFDKAATRIADNVANFLPGLVVLAVLLAVAVLLALVVRGLLLRLLKALDFDRRAVELGWPVSPEAVRSASPSLIIARVAQWTILVLGVLVGLTALDATMPSQFALSIFQFLPHLIAALFILIVGGLLARFLARSVLISAVNMGIQSARFLSLAVKWLLLIIAAAMALDHIGIGRHILLLAFGILFGGIVFAMALAIGLGAKDVVARALMERQVQQTEKPEDKLDHV